jgi:hypothetical protein
LLAANRFLLYSRKVDSAAAGGLVRLDAARQGALHLLLPAFRHGRTALLHLTPGRNGCPAIDDIGSLPASGRGD